MDAADDDDAGTPLESRSPSPSPSRSPIPTSTLEGAGAVTIAAPPLPHHRHQALTLALPIQRPTPPSSSREDCWSEGATSALIDAWGERFLDLSRGNLKQKHWQEVADAVSSRDDYTKAAKTDVQCKNRIDTLKKKYKMEKSKISNSPLYRSPWPFFDRLDLLLGPTHKPVPQKKKTPPPSAPPPLPLSKKTPPPPAPAPPPPPQLEEEEEGESWDSGMGEEGVREVARAVARLGDVYERVERGRMEMAEELERRRMAFVKEMEAQRVEFFVKAQSEISQLMKRRAGSRSSNATTSSRELPQHLQHQHQHQHQHGSKRLRNGGTSAGAGAGASASVSVNHLNYHHNYHLNHHTHQQKHHSNGSSQE